MKERRILQNVGERESKLTLDGSENFNENLNRAKPIPLGCLAYLERSEEETTDYLVKKVFP